MRPPGIRIDAHAHLFAPAQRESRAGIVAHDPTFAAMYADPSAKMATGPDLLTVLDQGDLDGAVGAGFAFAHERDIAVQNDHLAETARRSGGRIAWLAALNPALPGWRDEAERALALGARGFGELRPADQGWHPSASSGRAFLELADARGAVVLWHASEPVGHAYPGKSGGITAPELIETALAFPRLKMVAAHLGAGATFFLQMPELRDAIECVYFDTAAASLLYHKNAVARTAEIVGADRVLFGSDYPLLSPRRQLQAIENALPDDTARDSICGGNADALFFPSRLAKGTGVSRSGE